MQHYTTIAQSKKLVELGLNPDTADMLWEKHNCENSYVTVIPYTTKGKSIGAHILPCWSLGALIDLLPASIQTGKGIQNQYEIDIRKYYAGNKLCLYQIAYGNNKGLSREWHDMINTAERENLIDAVLDMICWLLENDYIKKGE
jgi:hypothetical protein